MGLRFRKSISILPGVRLNFGSKSASVSVGVPGFRKTFNTKGQVTTSVGIPGTGIYYVDTKKTGSNTRTSSNRSQRNANTTPAAIPASPVQEPVYTPAPSMTPATPQTEATSRQVSLDRIKAIHKAVDDTVDWTEVLCNADPPDESYNEEMWRYYHSVASSVLNGDIDTYLQVIYEVNPLDDLLDYGTGFEFGTDNSNNMDVEFAINVNALTEAKQSMSNKEYNDLLQDYVCSTAIRIARDMFALLPVRYTNVHAMLDDETILSVKFDRTTMASMRFGFLDPSDTMERFVHNMDYNNRSGFSRVERIEG